jgi:hypothetical protein
MNAAQRRTWHTHPDIRELRRFVGDTIQRDEHHRAMTAAALAVGVHVTPARLAAEYTRQMTAARGRLDRAMFREATL